MAPWMIEVMAHYMPHCGFSDPAEWPNSCNVNLYEDGTQSVGWHADDEDLFQGLSKDIRILSVSLGQRRKFDLVKMWPAEDEKPTERLHLHHGRHDAETLPTPRAKGRGFEYWSPHQSY